MKRKPRQSPLVKALQKQIDFWRTNQSDPYQIGNAVVASLYCVLVAVEEAEADRMAKR